VTVAEAVTLIGAITAAVVAIVGALASLRNGQSIGKVHDLVNGQSVRMEALATRTGFAEGSMPHVGNPPTQVSAAPPQTRAPGGESI